MYAVLGMKLQSLSRTFNQYSRQENCSLGLRRDIFVSRECECSAAYPRAPTTALPREFRNTIQEHHIALGERTFIQNYKEARENALLKSLAISSSDVNPC